MTTYTPFSFHPSFVKRDSSIPYQDRTEAGVYLAQSLLKECPLRDPLVLALPRGGMPVGFEVSKALSIPLDIFLVRKFSLPHQPDLAIGVVASGAVHTVNNDVIRVLDHQRQLAGLKDELREVLDREHAELLRRERSYRQSRPAEPIYGRSVIVVDDGLTTGSTMRNAIQALRLLHPARIIAAIPVASAEACAILAQEADTLICARTPENFFSVERWYRDFSPVLDHDIRNLLASNSATTGARAFHA